jgi:hypothetical protein
MLRKKIGTTNPDVYMYLESIYVTPEQSATIRYLVKDLKREQVTNYTYEMDGEQYKKWGNDDTIIYHLLCMKHGYQYAPYVEPEFFQEVNVWRDEETGEMKTEMVKRPNPKYTGEVPKIEHVPIPEGVATLYDDSRSVHNEADVQRIQTLQQQLDEQAAKLKTITELLFKNGAI